MISEISENTESVVLPALYNGFNSTAIKSVSIMNDQCTIVFNNSDKEYNYTIIDNNFEENLQNTINNGESVGKFITSAIKSENIQQINTIVQ
jgi:hypothetical protein